MSKSEERKAAARFGGSKVVKFSDGHNITIGELNTLDGYAMLPWNLHRYAKVLRLTPSELILAELYLIRQWEEDKVVWLSMTKWGKRLGVHPRTLSRARVKLEAKGYLTPAGMRQSGIIEYQVTGLLHALAICTMCDSRGKFYKERGYYLSESDAHAYMDDHELCFDLDFKALSEM